MKKTKYLPLLAVSLLLVACGGEVSSAAPSSVEPSSEAPTSVAEPSSEAPSSEEPKEVVLNLDGLKLGYRSRSGYSSVYTSSVDAVPEYKFETLVQTTVADEVVKFEQFSGKTWDEAVQYKVAQYELNSDKKIVTVGYGLDGQVVETATSFQDEVLLEGDPDISWQDAGLKNAYLDLEVEDFTKQEDGTWALNIPAQDSEDVEKVDAVDRLGDQLYLYLNGTSSTGNYFMNAELTSFVLTVDEEGNPVSYFGEFDKIEQWGTYKCQAVQGTYEEVGENLVSKAESFEKKYEELDAKFAELDAHNYQFNARANASGWSGSTYSYILNGKADGANIEVSKTSFNWAGVENGVATTGYKQTEATYRKYGVENGVATFVGTSATEGEAVSDFLPKFELFSSALFVKEEASTEDLSVYRLVKPELMSSITCGDLFNNFGVSATPTYAAVTDFVIVVTTESVTFKNVNGLNTATYEFFNIGSVSITTTVNEPSAA